MNQFLYNNQYRIPSARYSQYDYSSEGFYFVTWCVKNMNCVLSKVVDDKIVLSLIGEIVEKEIKKTEEVRKNVRVDSFVVMPNHVHVIIHIGPMFDSSCRDASVMRLNNQKKGDALPKRLYTANLGNIIKQIKIVSTKQIRNNHNPSFHWQSRFYDHIIRNDHDLQSHRDYIGINPIKWSQDKYFK